MVLPFGFQPLVVGFIATIAIFQIVWLLAYKHKRNDYADITWGPGFPLGAMCALAWTLSVQGRTGIGIRVIVVCTMITVWAMRLFWHVGRRNLAKGKEDPRYFKWRQEWGSTWIWRSYLQVFVLQALIMYIINFPAMWLIASPPQEMDLAANLGVLVWLIGFFFESVGDSQLKDFASHPENKGKIINVGLWKWSRHPNYFGEVTQWWGIYLLVVGVNGGWFTIISPLMITFLILKVSGVPMLEEQMKGRPGFADYQRRVSKFFPLPPKNVTSSKS